MSRGSISGRASVRLADGEPATMPGTPSLLRAINERAVLDLIQRDGPLSRAQVARTSRLSKPTVSLALAGLLDGRLVREVGRSRGHRGPSAILYELNPSAGYVVGIDVGRHFVRAAIADISGTILARRDERASVRSARSLIGQIGSIGRSLAGQAGIHWSEVTHATVGSPGVFDPERGLIALAPALPGWGRQGLVEAVRNELGLNVTFENDVNLAALGERANGHGRNVDNFVFLWAGTGVGLGLMLGGELYRGAHGAAGEIAYLPIGSDPDGQRRRGTFEESAAAAGIVRSAKALGMNGPLTPKRIFALARKGDRRASRAVEVEAARLATVVATITPILDPQLIILGGGIGLNGDLLLEPIERELRRVSPFQPRVVISALGEDAVCQGAVATALQTGRERVFSRIATRQLQELVG